MLVYFHCKLRVISGILPYTPTGQRHYATLFKIARGDFIPPIYASSCNHLRSLKPTDNDRIKLKESSKLTHFTIIIFILGMSVFPSLAVELGPKLVNTQMLSELVIYPKRSAPASTLSLNDSRISSELNARVTSIPVRVGESVDRKQLLATLNCEDYELRLKQSAAIAASSHALMKLAEKQLMRARSLVDRHNITKETLNQRETELEAAIAEFESHEAQRERDALNVLRCTLLSPFDGVVLERLVSEGEWVNIGSSVVRIIDSKRLEVSAQVPLQHIKSLKTAGNLWFESSGIKYPLTLRVITPTINTQSRNREIRLTFASESALPGTAGRLTWQATEPHLPANLLMRRDGQLGVFIVNDRKAHFKPLPGALEGHPAIISLPLESMIIVQGRHSLEDGDDIRN